MGRLLVLGLIAGCGSHPNSTASADAATGGPAVDAATATMVRVTLDNRPDHPAAFDFLVAFEDGEGPWQLAGTPNGDTYSFTTLSPTWSVAWTCASELGITRREVTIATFTVAERTTLEIPMPVRCTDRLPPVLAVTGAITNAPAGTGALYINLADLRSAAAGTSYTLQARLGVHDLIVRKIDHSNETATFATIDAFIERNLSVASSQHDLDLATALPTRAFDVSVPAGATGIATTLFYTTSGTSVTLARTATPLQTVALDASQVDAADVYDQQVELDGTGTTAILTNATLTPGALTVQPPAALGPVTASVAALSPYPRLEATWPTYGNAIGYTWVATQGPTDEDAWVRTWTALVSPGAAMASPSYRMPDLSALAGWNPEFGFRAGGEIEGYAEADTSTAGSSDFPSVTPPAVGTQRVFVRSDFTVTP